MIIFTACQQNHSDNGGYFSSMQIARYTASIMKEVRLWTEIKTLS